MRWNRSCGVSWELRGGEVLVSIAESEERLTDGLLAQDAARFGVTNRADQGGQIRVSIRAGYSGLRRASDSVWRGSRARVCV